MVYTKTITESSGGSASSPSQYRMAVTDGLIYQFELYLPPGSSGLLYVCVEDGGYRVWPSEPDEWFFGDNTLISFPDKYVISSAPHTLFIYAYNLDSEFDHKFQIRLGQVSDPVLIQSFLPSLQIANFQEEMATLIAAQDQSREAQRARVLASLDEGLPEPAKDI
jgi:hypothetical protein